MPSYHDLHVTAVGIDRTRLFDLPYGLQVTCSRVAGWELWRTATDLKNWQFLGGEYASPEQWLVLDVDGHVILDSRREPGPETTSEEP